VTQGGKRRTQGHVVEHRRQPARPRVLRLPAARLLQRRLREWLHAPLALKVLHQTGPRQLEVDLRALWRSAPAARRARSSHCVRRGRALGRTVPLRLSWQTYRRVEKLPLKHRNFHWPICSTSASRRPLPSSLRTFLKATACGRGRPRSAACLRAPRLRAALPGGGSARAP